MTYTLAMMRRDSDRALAGSRARLYEKRCRDNGVEPVSPGAIILRSAALACGLLLASHAAYA